jgi:hypothetical protein
MPSTADRLLDATLVARPRVRLAVSWVDANRIALVLAFIVSTGVYLWAHETHRMRPLVALPGHGFWSWFDQSQYLIDAQAWAAGSLDPLRHFYLPGYALLAVPFVWLTPAQPFMLPDLAFLLISLLCFVAITGRLLPGLAFAPGLGALVFLGSCVLHAKALNAWVVPWTTTPAATCTFAALALALRFPDRPSASRAFWIGLTITAIAAFRPTDVMPLAIGIPCFLLWTVLRARLRVGEIAGIAAAGAAGMAIPVLALLGLHLAVYGTAPGAYVILSREIGFEWRLVPIRWVTLILSPRPLLPRGTGLAEMFWWIIPGIAGMAAMLAVAPWRQRAAHLLVIATLAMHCVTYLAYRDLHVYGLWGFGNYHYFKWELPVYALYAVLLPVGLVVSRRRIGILAAAATILVVLLPWRAAWRIDPAGAAGPAAPILAPTRLTMPQGFDGLDEAVAFVGSGTQDQVYFGKHRLLGGGHVPNLVGDVKILQVPGGEILTLLRPPPAGPTEVAMGEGAILDPAIPPVVLHQHLVWGLPCWLAPEAPRCFPTDVLPGPAFPLDRPVPFGGPDAPYLGIGWSGLEPYGRWTDGKVALLRLQPPIPPKGRHLQLLLAGQAYMPGRAAPLRLAIYANHRLVGTWRVPRGDVTLTADIPADAANAFGTLDLRLELANPRRPMDWVATDDHRRLGFFAHSLELRLVADR